MRDLKTSKYITKKFETPSNEFAEWFGYYNYDPLSSDGSKILCNRSKTENCRYSAADVIEVGYYDVSSNTWHKIGTTNSWNWQQGAMMQWLPGIGNEDKVIYNCSKGNHLTARIYDISTGIEKDIDWSIYGITPDGKKSISIDLERSYWCRAYHYQSVANQEKEGRVVDGDGIFDIDLENNTRKLLIPIQDIIEIDSRSYFNNRKHWLEHVMISKDGSKFCFLHRFSPIDNVLTYETRLIIANIDGSDMQVIPNWERYVWSHFGWNGNDSFAIYCYGYDRPVPSNQAEVAKSNGTNTKESQLVKLKREVRALVRNFVPFSVIRAIRGAMQYYQYYQLDTNGFYTLVRNFDNQCFGIDGHPSFTTDGKFMITDTYPDKHNIRRLMILNTENNKTITVAQFRENNMLGCAQCDLHPKLSRDNQYIMVDTTDSGGHSLILFGLNWPLIINELK